MCFVYVYGPCVCLVPTEAGRGMEFPKTGITESWELPSEWWKLNLGPSLLLATEPQSHLSRPILPCVDLAGLDLWRTD